MDPLSIVSIALGILSWCMGCCIGVVFSLAAVIVLPFSIAGLVLGIVSARRIQAEPEMYNGMPLAVVGIVINGLQLLSMLLLAVVFAMAIVGVVAIPMLEGTF